MRWHPPISLSRARLRAAMRGAALQQRQAVCGASLPPPRAPARRRSAPAPPPHAAKSRRNPPRPNKAAAAGETEQLRVDLGVRRVGAARRVPR